jgi:iron complex outermembrane recepter protein
MKRFLVVFILANCFVFHVFSQTLIEGTVTGVDKKPLEDAHVLIPSKGIATITDSKGMYQLKVNLSGLQTIRVSYSGYKTNEQQISVISGSKNKVVLNLNNLL